MNTKVSLPGKNHKDRMKGAIGMIDYKSNSHRQKMKNEGDSESRRKK